MIVVSNTSPLNYLVLLGKVHVLPEMFGSVYAPQAVVAELLRKAAPAAVRAWVESPPAWFHVQAPGEVDASLDLDAVEREAIALAEELHADRILLDEAKARKAAISRGLKVAGTLAVLFEASQRGLLDFRQAVSELRATNFYIDENLVQAILDRTE